MEIKVACLVGRLATNHNLIALEASMRTHLKYPIMTRTGWIPADLEMTKATKDIISVTQSGPRRGCRRKQSLTRHFSLDGLVSLSHDCNRL